MKERVSLSLDKDLLKTVDKTIDGLHVKNRSHAIELLLRKSFEHDEVIKVVILAGGKGVKLRPLTYELPSTMIPINSKPVLEYIITKMRDAGLYNIVLCVGHMAEKIISYLGDGSRLGIRLEYVIEKEDTGTAGVLKLAEEKLSDTFVLVNGDTLSGVDVLDMISTHKSNKALVTMSLSEVEDPTQVGVVEMKGNKIVDFVEKPAKENAPSNLSNAGCYVMSKKVLEHIGSGPSMLEDDVFPVLAKKGLLWGYVFQDYWMDVDNLGAYEKVQQDIAKGAFPFK